MKPLAIVLVIVLSLVSASRCAAATEGESREGGGGTPPTGNQIDPEKLDAARREAIAKSGIQPREDEEVSRLAYGGLGMRAEQAQAVLALGRERVVAALAHEILDVDRGRYYMCFVTLHLPAERLVPFLAARIRLSPGFILEETLSQLQLAPSKFLRGLVPVLIEYALNSDYEIRLPPGRQHPMFSSALIATTRLLDKITEGKTGIKPVVVYGDILLPESEAEAKKAELRAAWRTWWAANKDNWPPKEEETRPETQTESPPQENPEVTDKG